MQLPLGETIPSPLPRQVVRKLREWLRDISIDHTATVGEIEWPIPARRADRLCVQRELEFLERIEHFPRLAWSLTPKSLAIYVGELERLRPAWARQTILLRFIHGTLGIEDLGLIPYSMTIKLKAEKVSKQVYKGKTGGLDGQLRRELQRKLMRRLGYAAFLFSVDVEDQEGAIKPRPFGNAHLHGVIGLYPADTEAAYDVLMSATGGLTAKNHAIDLQPVHNVRAWSKYSTRHVDEARSMCGQADFAWTANVRDAGRKVYQESGLELGTIKRIIWDRGKVFPEVME